MLSSDSLRRYAAERGMPEGKLRGALREYVQVAALKALYGLPKTQDLLFLGGTALRLGHGLSRFSEDLDFDVQTLSLGAWKKLLEETGHVLSKQGFSMEIKTVGRGSLLSGDLRFKELLHAYGMTQDAGEKLRIKFEANRPDYPLSAEPRVVTGYGEIVPVPFAASGLMLAEKILALLNREMGRDVYDLFFMAARKWVPDVRVFKARMLQTPKEAVLKRVRAWGPDKLSAMARQLEPFLFKPEEVRLVAQADRLLPSALEYWN